MLNFSTRSLQKELLDADNIPSDDLALNMKELNIINTYLGGHAITLHGFKKLVGKRITVSVLEIGCGGGDNLKAIENYCKKNDILIELIGIDISQYILAYAIAQNNNLQTICNDYKHVILHSKPDIIFSSLFCHHFSDEELITQLQWMHSNANLGFFINDLHRHAVAYYTIKIITRIFSSSYLVKHDAPLSVARGFTKIEWESLCKKAHLTISSIQWKWAFRHLILFQHHGK
jgi:SAM-dependent methyltransferase